MPYPRPRALMGVWNRLTVLAECAQIATYPCPARARCCETPAPTSGTHTPQELRSWRVRRRDRTIKRPAAEGQDSIETQADRAKTVCARLASPRPAHAAAEMSDLHEGATDCARLHTFRVIAGVASDISRPAPRRS